jgi:ABC-2 type transport system ATP-binding protein
MPPGSPATSWPKWPGLATRIGILHEGRLVREITATELSTEVPRWLSVSTRDTRAARAALEKAEWSAELDGDGLRLFDPTAVRFPERVATVLVNAGCPPTRLVVDAEDLETYFLRTVGHTTAVGHA